MIILKPDDSYIPPNTTQVMSLASAYIKIEESSVLAHHFSNREMFLRDENRQQYLFNSVKDLARVVLWTRQLPQHAVELLIEPFDAHFYPSKAVLKVNSFARLRLAYDQFLGSDSPGMYNNRYKTLAIMTDPKMNVIKHNLEKWYLDYLAGILL